MGLISSMPCNFNLQNLKYRSAKLVAKALGPNSTEAQFRKEELSERKVVKMLRMLGSNINPLLKVLDPLKEECLEFLHSCGFDELTFVEIEAVTFR